MKLVCKALALSAWILTCVLLLNLEPVTKTSEALAQIDALLRYMRGEDDELGQEFGRKYMKLEESFVTVKRSFDKSCLLLKEKLCEQWDQRLGFLYASSPLSDQAPTSLTLSSPAFKENSSIPMLYTKEGKDISPPLAWKNSPRGTRSFVLICDDPDARAGPWIHWIIYNIPPTLDHLEEGGTNFPPGTRLGKNSWGDLTYGGPLPPSGIHHYRFTLYALDRVLELKEGATEEQVNKSMQGHILAKVTLVGLYQLQH